MRLGKHLLILSVISLLLATTYSVGGGYNTISDSNYTFIGKNIGFSFDFEDWEMEHVSAYNVSLIEKICLPSAHYSPISGFKSYGNFNIETGGYKLSVSNFSSPSISYMSLSQSIVKIYFKNGVSIENNSILSIEKEGVKADIISDGGIKINGRTVEISLENGDNLQIRFYKACSESAHHQLDNALINAFKLRKIGAEAQIDMKKENVSFISYNNISMKKVSFEKKKIVLKIISEDREGRCIILHLSINSTNISVLLDNEKVNEGSYYDALFSTGNESVYNITESDGSVTLIVYIPHFSEHTLTIEEENVSAENSINPQVSGESDGLSMMAVITAIALSALAGIALFWKRR